MPSGTSFTRGQNQVTAIDYYHARVHQGIMFSVDNESESLPNNGTLGLLMKTNGNEVHLLWDGENGGDARVDFYEGTTTTDDGTPKSPVARNRNTTFVTTTEMFRDPTIDALGTLLDSLVLPGGQGGNAGGGGGAVLLDWSLKPDTNYYLVLTNLSGQSQLAHIHIDFYEDL